MCGALGAPRAAYYRMLPHPEPEPADGPIAADAVGIHEGSRRECGAPKMKRAPAKEGVVASRRRIKRIMDQKGPASAYSRKKYRPHAPEVSEAEAPNALNRESDGRLPHTHIVSDLAYVRVGRGRSCVCLLVDLHNREIVGHAASDGKDAWLTGIDAFHADRGGEFANFDMDELLEAFGIRRPLSRKGNPHDNAVIESTNKILKRELVYRRAFASLDQLRRELNSYVRWYNEERMHSKLGYMSPVEFRNAGLSL